MALLFFRAIRGKPPTEPLSDEAETVFQHSEQHQLSPQINDSLVSPPSTELIKALHTLRLKADQLLRDDAGEKIVWLADVVDWYQQVVPRLSKDVEPQQMEGWSIEQIQEYIGILFCLRGATQEIGAMLPNCIEIIFGSKAALFELAADGESLSSRSKRKYFITSEMCELIRAVFIVISIVMPFHRDWAKRDIPVEDKTIYNTYRLLERVIGADLPEFIPKDRISVSHIQRQAEAEAELSLTLGTTAMESILSVYLSIDGYEGGNALEESHEWKDLCEKCIMDSSQSGRLMLGLLQHNSLSSIMASFNPLHDTLHLLSLLLSKDGEESKKPNQKRESSNSKLVEKARKIYFSSPSSGASFLISRVAADHSETKIKSAVEQIATTLLSDADLLTNVLELISLLSLENNAAIEDERSDDRILSKISTLREKAIAVLIPLLQSSGDIRSIYIMREGFEALITLLNKFLHNSEQELVRLMAASESSNEGEEPESHQHHIRVSRMSIMDSTAEDILRIAVLMALDDKGAKYLQGNRDIARAIIDTMTRWVIAEAIRVTKTAPGFEKEDMMKLWDAGRRRDSSLYNEYDVKSRDEHDLKFNLEHLFLWLLLIRSTLTIIKIPGANATQFIGSGKFKKAVAELSHNVFNHAKNRLLATIFLAAEYLSKDYDESDESTNTLTSLISFILTDYLVYSATEEDYLPHLDYPIISTIPDQSLKIARQCGAVKLLETVKTPFLTHWMTLIINSRLAFCRQAFKIACLSSENFRTRVASNLLQPDDIGITYTQWEAVPISNPQTMGTWCLLFLRYLAFQTTNFSETDLALLSNICYCLQALILPGSPQQSELRASMAQVKSVSSPQDPDRKSLSLLNVLVIVASRVLKIYRQETSDQAKYCGPLRALLMLFLSWSTAVRKIDAVGGHQEIANQQLRTPASIWDNFHCEKVFLLGENGVNFLQDLAAYASEADENDLTTNLSAFLFLAIVGRTMEFLALTDRCQINEVHSVFSQPELALLSSVTSRLITCVTSERMSRLIGAAGGLQKLLLNSKNEYTCPTELDAKFGEINKFMYGNLYRSLNNIISNQPPPSTSGSEENRLFTCIVPLSDFSMLRVLQDPMNLKFLGTCILQRAEVLKNFTRIVTLGRPENIMLSRPDKIGINDNLQQIEPEPRPLISGDDKKSQMMVDSQLLANVFDRLDQLTAKINDLQTAVSSLTLQLGDNLMHPQMSKNESELVSIIGLLVSKIEELESRCNLHPSKNTARVNESHRDGPSEKEELTNNLIGDDSQAAGAPDDSLEDSAIDKLLATSQDNSDFTLYSGGAQNFVVEDQNDAEISHPKAVNYSSTADIIQLDVSSNKSSSSRMDDPNPSRKEGPFPCVDQRTPFMIPLNQIPNNNDLVRNDPHNLLPQPHNYSENLVVNTNEGSVREPLSHNSAIAKQSHGEEKFSDDSQQVQLLPIEEPTPNQFSNGVVPSENKNDTADDVDAFFDDLLDPSMMTLDSIPLPIVTDFSRIDLNG